MLSDLAEELLRLTDDPMLVVSGDGQIIGVNNSFCTLLGTNSDNLVSRSLAEIVVSDTPLNEVANLLHQLLNTGSWLRSKLVLKHSNGNCLEFSCKGTVLQKHLEEQPPIVAIQSESKIESDAYVKTIQSLRQDIGLCKNSENQLKTVMNGLDAVVFVTDFSSGKILFSNQSGQNLANSVIDQLTRASPADSRLLDRSGRPAGMQLGSKLIDGEWYECREQAVQWTDSRLVRLGIANNVTERKHHEEELRRRSNAREAAVQELTQRETELRAILALTESLQTCHSLDEAYSVIKNAAADLFTGLSGGLTIYDGQAGLLETIMEWGERAVLASSFTKDDCWAFRSGGLHEAGNGETPKLCRHFRKGKTRNSVCIPLVVQGDMYGLFHVVAPANGRIEPSRRLLAVGFSETIKLALSNIRLREKLSAEATQDALTGLFNRRFLNNMLPPLYHSSQRAKRSFCAAILDVDHFKKFNDQFGHDAGDSVLRHLGHILKQNLRKSDIACRYGGEEFSVILPDCRVAGAQSRLQGISQILRTEKIRHKNIELPSVTVSIGLTEVPANTAMTPEDILKMADDALYEAKQSGRDRIVVH